MELQDKEYKYLAQLSEDYNIPLNIMFNRVLKYGWSIEKATSKPVSEKFKVSIEIDEVMYKSYKALADTFNLDYKVVVDRLNHGWVAYDISLATNNTIGVILNSTYYTSYKEIDRVFKLPLGTVLNRVRNGKLLKDSLFPIEVISYDIVVYKGEEYKLDELAIIYKIDSKIVRNRLSKGWDLERALATPKLEILHTVEYKDVIYDSLSKLTDSLGLSYGTIKSRLSNGWDLIDAIEKPVKEKGYYYNNKFYTSLKELAIEYNISSEAIRGALRRKLNIDEAVESAKIYAEKKYEYRGETYNTVKEVAEKFSLNYHSFKYRVQNGWDLALAIETPIVTKNEVNKVTILTAEDILTIKDIVDKYNIDTKKLTINGLAKALNIAGKTIRSRLKNGCTLREAILSPVKKFSHLTNIPYNGNIYDDLTHLADTLNLDRECIRNNLKRNCSVERL